MTTPAWLFRVLAFAGVAISKVGFHNIYLRVDGSIAGCEHPVEEPGSWEIHVPVH